MRKYCVVEGGRRKRALPMVINTSTLTKTSSYHLQPRPPWWPEILAAGLIKTCKDAKTQHSKQTIPRTSPQFAVLHNLRIFNQWASPLGAARTLIGSKTSRDLESWCDVNSRLISMNCCYESESGRELGVHLYFARKNLCSSEFCKIIEKLGNFLPRPAAPSSPHPDWHN